MKMDDDNFQASDSLLQEKKTSARSRQFYHGGTDGTEVHGVYV